MPRSPTKGARRAYESMASRVMRLPVNRVAPLALCLALCVYLLLGGGSASSGTSGARGGNGGAFSLATSDGRPFPGHVLVTGGAGFIGSHATMRLLELGHAVTIVDNYSRGNRGAVRALQKLAPPRKLRVVEADIGIPEELERAFDPRYPIDVVMHFAAIAFVGEAMEKPLLYYHNVTSNTVGVLEAMKRHKVKRLVYSSTCATYGNPDVMPITEKTPTAPINAYGRSKLYSENAVRDHAKSDPGFDAAILRYFNVFGADPRGRLGEYPPPSLMHHGRISTACFDAALGNRDELVVTGTEHPTDDGTCVRDYVHVTDLIDAHVAVMRGLKNPPALYNVGTGKGVSVKEFVRACKKVTGGGFAIREVKKARPGDHAVAYADPSLIQKELGWKARYVDLEESLGHAWAWRLAHKSGY